jgi:ubiquinone biosynthesis protein UbiJ
MTALPTALAAVLETAINQVLRLDSDTVEKLHSLQGKVIAVELRGLNIKLYLVPQHNALNVFAHFEGEPDTLLRGTPISMVRMGLAKNAGDVLFEGDVEISGDVELGQQFREILDGLDIDWEEHLSHITGDIIAHKVGNLARGVIGWGKRTTEILGQDAAEYLQQESCELPERAEVDEFLKNTDTIRSDVDRMGMRVVRLERKIGGRLDQQLNEGHQGNAKNSGEDNHS